MGSDSGCLQPKGCHLNGLIPNKSESLPRVLDTERWRRAEVRTADLIAHIQPDQPSWESRNAVASYVQRLITQSIPCVVFIYGSVPLKTYLPDGDIDLTVFSEDQKFDHNYAAEVSNILEKAGNNEDAEYQIKEVQLIPAEVKVVKCLVDNIIVDISFSQLGGLCTLCFLEQVDQHINQNHLFKRSIILIKAWCYYESRLLGAYHGLLSTYALETLILYIFHVFNNSFAGPLEVLYRFLEFFSNFDWDNFCISLQGPVPVRSLPDMTANPPRKDDGALSLSKRFLDACSFYYSACPSTPETKERFGSKHLNIIDFLRVNNNLGRSVSRGNFSRIRSALAFGAKRLAGLLDCPKQNVVTELNRFFMNTWYMNGRDTRPDTHFVHTSGVVNWCQMEKEEEVDDQENIFYCSEYIKRMQNTASVQTNACFHPEDGKQYELYMENGDSVGKCGRGKEFVCPSYTNSVLKVSPGKWKDGSPLISNDSLGDRFLKALTMNRAFDSHKNVLNSGKWKDGSPLMSDDSLGDRFWKALTMDRACNSHTNVFQHFCHEEDDRFWNTEMKVLPTEALFTCPRTPDWDCITSVPLHPRFGQTAVHKPPLVPCVITNPNLPYTRQGEGKRKVKRIVSPSGTAVNSRKSKESSIDILSGDLASHFSNMMYARSCQHSKFEGPDLFHPSIVPAKYLEGQFLSAVNHTVFPEATVAPSSCHNSDELILDDGVFPEARVASSSYHNSDELILDDGDKHCLKGISTYGTGTGTHTPNLKTEKSCKDLRSLSNRNQKGNNSYRHRKDHYKERQVYSSFTSKPHFGDRRQWEYPNARNSRGHMQWIALGEQQPSLAEAKRVSDRLE